MRRFNNPILDTQIYKVLFNDRLTQEYVTNRIALSIFDQIDLEGKITRLLDSIGVHRSDYRTIKKIDGFFKDSRGCNKRNITT